MQNERQRNSMRHQHRALIAFIPEGIGSNNLRLRAESVYYNCFRWYHCTLVGNYSIF
jgi:hypothetical protein